MKFLERLQYPAILFCTLFASAVAYGDSGTNSENNRVVVKAIGTGESLSFPYVCITTFTGTMNGSGKTIAGQVRKVGFVLTTQYNEIPEGSKEVVGRKVAGYCSAEPHDVLAVEQWQIFGATTGSIPGM